MTYRLRAGLPSLRRSLEYRWIRYCFAYIQDREGFRLVHYSVQSNHIHLLVEAESGSELSRGLQAIAIRLAKRLNAAWKREGSLFDERYHARALATPREVRNALAYVLKNAQHHGRARRWLTDLFSSAEFFDGWSTGGRLPGALVRAGPPPIAPPRTWLLTVGWRRHGPIHPLAVPGSGR